MPRAAMSPEPYDLSLVFAQHQVVEAKADMAEVVGTRSAMFVWMRKASYERAVHAQETGLHHIHRIIGDTGAACTCGRVVPLVAARDPLNQSGHLDRDLREIWIVPAKLWGATPAEQSECVRLHCSRCAWTATTRVPEALRAGRLHLLRRHPLLLLNPRRRPEGLS